MLGAAGGFSGWLHPSLWLHRAAGIVLRRAVSPPRLPAHAWRASVFVSVFSHARVHCPGSSQVLPPVSGSFPSHVHLFICLSPSFYPCSHLQPLR